MVTICQLELLYFAMVLRSISESVVTPLKHKCECPPKSSYSTAACGSNVSWIVRFVWMRWIKTKRFPEFMIEVASKWGISLSSHLFRVAHAQYRSGRMQRQWHKILKTRRSCRATSRWNPMTAVVHIMTRFRKTTPPKRFLSWKPV